MKRLIATAFVASVLAGCNFLGGPVADLKGSTLEFDSSITVGQAFDSYFGFRRVKWNDLTQPTGRVVVEVAGEVDLDKCPDVQNVYLASGMYKTRKYTTVYRFVKLKDGPWEIYSSGYRFVDADTGRDREVLPKPKGGLLDMITGPLSNVLALRELTTIYRNEKCI